MDLWILCAEKANLIKVDNVYIEEFYGREMTFYYEIRTKKNDDEICLGYFETKERAKEVIGEIQKLVNQNVMRFVNSPCSLDLKDALKVKEYADTYGVIPSDRAMGEIKYISPNSVVFEMPKE